MDWMQKESGVTLLIQETVRGPRWPKKVSFTRRNFTVLGVAACFLAHQYIPMTMLTISEQNMTFSIIVMYKGNGFLFRVVMLPMRLDDDDDSFQLY